MAFVIRLEAIFGGVDIKTREILARWMLKEEKKKHFVAHPHIDICQLMLFFLTTR
jgi:hypothetical protein